MGEGNKRTSDLVRFYSILRELEKKLARKLILADCSGRMDWPKRGIYFFFERSQLRSDTGSGLRVTRIGTHALKKESKTTLWNRLSQHKGQVKTGGGNHRGSIFRLLVGTAFINNLNLNYPTWGKRSSAPKEIREKEQPLEIMVSSVIGEMPFLHLSINDESGPDSLRGYIERNSIALLSNYNKTSIDPPIDSWIGSKCDRKKVRNSGMWNQNHIDKDYDPEFLIAFRRLVSEMIV